MIITFPSTDQFYQTVKNVRSRADHHKMDRLPVLRYHGTVKLHGANCGVIKDLKTGKITAQSREVALTLEADHFGFAKSGLDWKKDVSSEVARMARAWFLEKVVAL